MDLRHRHRDAESRLAKKGSQLQIKSRGTGMLIGPRYVLTALHVLGTLDANNKLQEVHSLQVSPARNGNNTKNPFRRDQVDRRFACHPMRDVGSRLDRETATTVTQRSVTTTRSSSCRRTSTRLTHKR